MISNGYKSLISVIIPFYNAEEYLEVAIKSVLDQTYPHWEIILVNDGSTDGSEAIAAKYIDNNKIFLLAHEDKKNKGVAISRALAIANANGEYISFLDADDFFSVDKLKKHIEVFDEFGNVLLVHSSANCLNESINSFFYEFKFHKINEQYSLLEGDFLKKNFICNSSVTVRSKFLKKIELSFPQLFQYEDWITWILLAQQGDFYFIDSPLCTYRYHENSSTSQLFKNKISFMYAKLEMLYILLHRLETKSMKIKIENALRHHLLQISALYKLDEHENTNSIFKKLLLKIVKLFKIK